MTTVIVTSVLNPSSNPLDYASIRSIYSPPQRVEQSLKTIASIRKNMGGVRIVFVDCSVALPDEARSIKDCLYEQDKFIDLSKNSFVLNSVASPNKSYGELMLLDWAISNLSFHGDIFKISGRYYLNDEFNLDVFDKTADVNCKTRGFHFTNDKNICLTAFYRMRNKEIYSKYIEYGKTIFERFPYISAEHALFKFITDSSDLKIQTLDKVGLSGNIAVSGSEETN